MNLRVFDVLDEREISSIVNFVSKQQQFYPKFNDWLNDKLKPRLLSGRYKSFMGIDDNKVSGCLIYDMDSDKVRIKNFRIDSGYQYRFLGQFLLKQVELFKKPIETDITVNNFNAVKFFMQNGFDILAMEELYQKNQFEYIISKNI